MEVLWISRFEAFFFFLAIYTGFLLRFELAGTNVSIAGTKVGVGGEKPLPLGGRGGLPQKMLEFLRPQGAFWAISGQFGFLF